MADEKPRVLIVDDSLGDIRIVNENLKSQYTTQAATSGEKALAIAVQEPKPEVILMDVEMPGMNGYETCKKLKANPESADIDVIFVSAHDNVEDIVAGYDAGGTDYLTKPIEPIELKRKIEIAVNNRRHRHVISNEKRNVEQIAKSAMTIADEQGVLLQFMRDSLVVTDLAQLAEIIVSAIQRYDLANSVQIRALGRTVDRASNGCVVPLEQELLTRLKDQARVIEKGPNAIFNFGAISLLIKNTQPNSEKWQRLREDLSLLTESAHARYWSLLAGERIADAVANLSQASVQFNRSEKVHRKESQRLALKIMSDLEQSYPTLGLQKKQEQHLSELIQKGVDESLNHQEKGLEIEAVLQKIMTQLKSL